MEICEALVHFGRMPNVAEHRLKELCSGIQHQSSPKTLAYFRLSNPAIIQDLEDFAATPNSDSCLDTNTKPFLDQVLDLFKRLNLHMAEQERSCPTWSDFFVASKAKEESSSQTINVNERMPHKHSPTEISVVFGGKFSKNPASISEQLVSKLVRRSQTVYTVSRSACKESDLPNNVKHVPKQNLDVSDASSNDGSSIGSDEFYDVMSLAKEEWLKTSRNQQQTILPTTTVLVFYFTLGQHKGVNPFVRNLNSAQNFHRALLKLSSCPEFVRSASSETKAAMDTNVRSWRVVVTGTDATLPSTHPPSEMKMAIDDNDSTASTVLTVPTYKIGANNFVYAMSKLGQYYWIANAIAHLLMVQNDEKNKDRFQEIARETEDIFQKIKKHVTDAGEDGAYHGSTVEEEASARSSISIQKLDAVSLQMSSLMEEGRLRDHFRIAEQISICYTPLHAKPWTHDAIQHTTRSMNTTSNSSISNTMSIGSSSSASPSSSCFQQQQEEEEGERKAFILEQIVKRFKNAISIESAASSHLLQEKQSYYQTC